ncbi:hypothetical protein GCM10007385_31660 [Tateyamaria omphalii]|uniref:class I SAM-dependent methyltransferase n=1 Tax=Tateyamaria omphalii TaxID=299262 RepID=UPI0016797E97|nr:class I SAM-dependent methyltransferase [Tateyamaria omphalii]GGX60076.1 hypothetical protein GCM10007385_31660 [Tateyamaria omphalii]
MKQFNKVAELYANVRPTYPRQVYVEILERNGNVRFQQAVDIGSGAGHSTVGLELISNQITGVEPGDQLRLEAINKFTDYQFISGSGENTTLPDDYADLITVATAFYWMDRQKTIHEISRIVKPKGILALYRYLFPKIMSDANAVLVQHCEKYWDKYRDPRLVCEDDSDKLLAASGLFSDIERFPVENIWNLSVDRFVGFLRSTSYVSKYLEEIGDGAENYLHELSVALADANGADMLDVNFDIHMILAKSSKG